MFCYEHAHYQAVYYCSATNRPITRLNATVLLPTGRLPDCKLLLYYPHDHYQTLHEYYCSANHRPTIRLYTTVTLPTGQPPDCMLLFGTTVRLHKLPITRLYTGLLPTGPLPDCILLFVYPQANYQTVYCCSATNIPITRLYTTVLLPTGP